MTNEDFDMLVQRRISLIDNVLCEKAKEYAHEGDRLYNFKVAASFTKGSLRKALWGMALKHLVSVIDIVENNLPNEAKVVDEKVGDLINYLILLEAVLEEERNATTDSL